MIVGCYDFRAYCDAPEAADCKYGDDGVTHRAIEMTDRTEAACLRRLRALGWTYNRRTGKAFCREHRRLPAKGAGR